MSEEAAAPPTVESAVEPVIRAKNLARWYGDVIALTDVTVSIPPGITGLLGPNGAGKSTLMRLLTGQIFPSQGWVRILGRNPTREPEVFRDVGFCSEDDALFESWTAREMVTFLARLAGYPVAEARDRAQRSMERTGIVASAERKIGGFSKGMRQRTRLAGTIVHDPRLVLLDEPMTGLDPVGRRDVVELVQALAADGCSVIFASHILHEVESVAEHVVVIHQGMTLAEGTLTDIRESLGDYAFTMEIDCSDPRRLARALIDHDHVISVTFGEGGSLRVSTSSAQRLVPDLTALILDHDVDVNSLSCPDENLESLFRRLVQ